MSTPAPLRENRCARLIPLAVLAVAAAARPAAAATWTFSKSIEAEETYNDNVRLTSTGQQSDYITRLSPHLGIRGTGARVQLSLDYSLDQYIFLKNTGGDRTVNTLSATGHSELLKDFFFVDAAASISEQFISAQNAVSGTAANITSNRTSVQTYTLSPYFRNHFSGWADSETRYRFTSVSSGTSQFADTIGNEVSYKLNSGREFGRLSWTLFLDAQDTDRGRSTTFGGDTTVKHRLAQGSVQYAVTRWLAIVGSYGYEKIEDPTLLQKQPSGPIWNAGILLTGVRTSARITYGEQYNTNVLNVDASYRPTSRTSLTATYTETLQTTQQLLLNNLTFLGVDASGNLIDTRTGLPFVPGTADFSLVNQTFRTTRFAATGIHTRGRDTYTAQAFEEERTGTLNAFNDQTVTGGGASWKHLLSRETNLNIAAQYSTTEFAGTPQRTDDIITASANLGHDLSKDVHTWLRYSLTRRDSTVNTADITENVVSVGLRKDF
jgi:uncharacterized protein (PEP-CTERM system associated)